jgi:hypothetical protein
MTVRYKADYKGTGELMNGPEMQAVLRQIAEKGKAFAESISPERTGEYKASFEVTSRSHGGVHGDRAEAQIVNTSDHAARVEWQDNYHVLARTADALGTL